MFSLDPDLLHAAAAQLRHRTDLYWILGGACTGKSTVCRALAEEVGGQRIDMDAHIYGGFHFDADRHPATTAWFSADNPLAWVLSLSPEDFDALNRSTNAEFLDLLAADLRGRAPGPPLLVDGGFTHPSVVAEAADPSHLVCLSISPDQSARCWETAEDRAQMRQWVRALPNPERMWARFLDRDRQVSETMVRESEAQGIPVLVRPSDATEAEWARSVAARLGLPAGA